MADEASLSLLLSHNNLNSALLEQALDVQNHIDETFSDICLDLDALDCSITRTLSRTHASLLNVFQKFVELGHFHHSSA